EDRVERRVHESLVERTGEVPRLAAVEDVRAREVLRVPRLRRELALDLVAGEPRDPGVFARGLEVAADRDRGRLGLEDGEGDLEPVGLDLDVRLDDRDEATLRLAEAHVERGRLAAVLLAEDAHAGVALRDLARDLER